MGSWGRSLLFYAAPTPMFPAPAGELASPALVFPALRCHRDCGAATGAPRSPRTFPTTSLDGADRWSLMPINSRMFQELPKSTLLGVAVLVLLAGLFFALGFPWFRDRQAWTLCAAMYDKARSTADSAVIDAQQPLFGRGDAQVAVSCGALRSARSGAR